MKTAISELEESIVWVKTLAEVSKTTQEASKDLKDASHDSKKLALQSEAMLSELKDIRVNEEKLVNNSISAISQSKSQLEKSTVKMVDAHVELRQQIMSDLSGIRQSLSTYHQDQLDKIKEEIGRVEKKIEFDNSLVHEHIDMLNENSIQIKTKLESLDSNMREHNLQQSKVKRVTYSLLALSITILTLFFFLEYI